MNYIASFSIVLPLFCAYFRNGIGSTESVLKTVYSLELVPVSEYTLPEVSYPFFNLSTRVRKQKCIDALKATGFPPPLQDVEFYVPKAHIYKTRDDTRSDGHPKLIVSIRCPTLPPLYLVDGSADILQDPFLYYFNLESVKSVSLVTEGRNDVELTENALYKMDFIKKWRLCYEAMKYIRAAIIFENRSSPKVDIFEFEYSFWNEKYIAIECPTKPVIYLRRATTHSSAFPNIQVLIADSEWNENRIYPLEISENVL